MMKMMKPNNYHIVMYAVNDETGKEFAKTIYHFVNFQTMQKFLDDKKLSFEFGEWYK